MAMFEAAFCTLVILILVSTSAAARGESVKKVKSPCIGIDFGHDSFAVGVWLDGEAKLIPDSEGNLVVPTTVAFGGYEAESVVIGHAASRLAILRPAAAIRDLHALIGRTTDDASIAELTDSAPFRLIKDEGASEMQQLHVEFTTDGGVIRTSPEQIAASFLRQAKRRAEQFLRKKVLSAVVALPAGFGGGIRQALHDAAAMAGIKLVRIINEPTAALLAYGLHRIPGEHHAVVVHVGARELTASIATSGGGFTEVSKSLTSSGISSALIANKTAASIAKLLSKKQQADLAISGNEVAFIAAEIRRSMTEVFQRGQVELRIPDLRPGWDFTFTLTRKSVEAACKGLWGSVVLPLVERALREARVAKEDVDEYVLVGQLARSQGLKGLLRAFFSDKDASRGLNPEWIVGLGATVQAAILTGQASR